MGNFQGIQFLRLDDLLTFRGSIFADVHNCAIMSTYKRAYFMGLIFMVRESTMKTAKIGPLKISHYMV